MVAMNRTEETFAQGPVLRFLKNTSSLPGRLEASLRARPLATAAAVAGVAFVAGTIAGSRVARTVFVAAAPALVRRLLDGPLGEDLDAYVRSAFRKPAPSDVS